MGSGLQHVPQEKLPPPGFRTFGGVLGRDVRGFAPPLDPVVRTVGRVVVDPPPLRTVGTVRVVAPPLLTVGTVRVDEPPLLTVGEDLVVAPPLVTVGLPRVDEPPLLTVGRLLVVADGGVVVPTLPPGLTTLEEGRVAPAVEPLAPPGSVRIVLGEGRVDDADPLCPADGRPVEADGFPPEVPDRRLEPLSTPGRWTPAVPGGFPDVPPGLKADGAEDLGTARRFCVPSTPGWPTGGVFRTTMLGVPASPTARSLKP